MCDYDPFIVTIMAYEPQSCHTITEVMPMFHLGRIIFSLRCTKLLHVIFIVLSDIQVRLLLLSLVYGVSFTLVYIFCHISELPHFRSTLIYYQYLHPNLFVLLLHVLLFSSNIGVTKSVIC